MSESLSSPKGVVDMVIMRYGAGKDLVSHYTDNLASVDGSRISDMLSSLLQGGKVVTTGNGGDRSWKESTRTGSSRC